MRTIFALTCLALAGCTVFGPSQPPAAYVVFFPGSSLDVPPDAHGIITGAASEARMHPDQVVEVAGPSTKIAAGYNPGLAQPRINAVVRALEAQGIPENRIVQSSLTTTDVKTDITGAQRVEIHLVQQPAS